MLQGQKIEVYYMFSMQATRDCGLSAMLTGILIPSSDTIFTSSTNQ